MIVLAILFIGPIFLGAHLLGCSWELAAFIALLFYPALIVLGSFVAFLLDERTVRKRRKAAKQRREALARTREEYNRTHPKR